MNLELNNKTALVTASSAGIGLEIARSLAGEGATVIINGRSEKNVDAAIEAILKTHPDAKLEPLVADNSTAAGSQLTVEKFPQVDILINNLGIYEAVGFFDETDEAWQRLFETNIMSGVRLARHYLQGMLDRNHGRVVFLSSESGISPAPEMAHYSATKTMQLGISRSLAELTKGTKVTVNSVLPGPTLTASVKDFVKDVYPDLPAEQAERKFMEENRPSSLIQRFINPAEIGDIVTFVSSERAAVINGSNIRAEGGLIRTAF
ncbi:SDR family NAD(P)-dependent oxidoreductase [Persicirhabdus sediminis]|uniref:SDR family oxidoreductase n=1 Tax=Persicirhabdus sediminis TaxID=454144 RepID=A0A8J7SI17_9BACT|nr:SDR family oxidoreductase [Persicirhabdus sediminis]MBK1791160.1 SDR family oxidoreductase [Persicirhabdus sediminis]